jgi:hypothetical protein
MPETMDMKKGDAPDNVVKWASANAEKDTKSDGKEYGHEDV